jgi:hypothetical protein
MSSDEVDRRRDEANWAKPVETLTLKDAPEGAINMNVTGKRVTSPMQGFGKMWQKTYKVRFTGTDVSPGEVITTWKQNFSSFWPPRNNFYGPVTGIAPGEVALLNLSMPGRMKLSTGVLVLYADEESFTLMTPEGHMLAGLITFSAFEDTEGTVAQAQVLMRTYDPFYEVGAIMFGHRKEDRFWQHTLRSLASHFGVVDAQVQTSSLCVDKKRQWNNARNISRNSFFKTTGYVVSAPMRWFGKGKKHQGTTTGS